MTCKIRVFPKLEDTLAYAKMIEAAGCNVLAVRRFASQLVPACVFCPEAARAPLWGRLQLCKC